jgi:hypothetical protein
MLIIIIDATFIALFFTENNGKVHKKLNKQITNLDGRDGNSFGFGRKAGI